MKKQLLSALFVLSLALPAEMTAQVDLSKATYIGVQQWRDTVNALPGVDRQIVSQDIGALNLSVGIIHRNATGPAGVVEVGAELPRLTAAFPPGSQAAPGESSTFIRPRRTSSSRARERWSPVDRS